MIYVLYESYEWSNIKLCEYLNDAGRKAELINATNTELMETMNPDDVYVNRVFPRASTFQALVAILDLKRILLDIDAGTPPSECWSALVCHQDGTCNGLQHMSAITRNRQTAETVNCTRATRFDVPQDIYGIIATKAREFASTEAVFNLLYKYGRDMAKDPVMITGYGAGEDTIKANIAVYLLSKGESTLHADAIGDCYIQSINANAGAVKALTSALKARVKQAMTTGQSVFEWQTYDGFKVSIEYKDIEPMRVRAGVFNAMMKDVVCVRDDVKTVGALAPNFIHSIDSTHCRTTVLGCDWDLVSVHDSIGSHPCNYFATGDVIRTTFAEVHEYDALGNLCENMGARKPKFRGDYDAIEALEATYIFS
jgi:DNA-directed RNA polymerase